MTPTPATENAPRKRFIPAPTPDEYKRYDDGKSRWWYDTARPIAEAEREDPEQPYILVEVAAHNDPNDYRKIEGEMMLLFTDQAEYHAVCFECYSSFSHIQWSGSTHGGPGWRERAQQYLETHSATKGWCQFCDPIFGNGGWVRRGGDHTLAW